MKKLTFLLVILCSWYEEVHGWIETLNVEEDCSIYKERLVNDNHHYEIEWNGGRIPNSSCSFPFLGFDRVTRDRYKVCITSLQYNISDCNVEMKYETGAEDRLYASYSCNDTVNRLCGHAHEYVEVTFDTKFANSTNQNAGYIRLKVTAIMTYNNAARVGYIVAGVMIGVILLTSFITLVVCRLRRNRSRITALEKRPLTSSRRTFSYTTASRVM